MLELTHLGRAAMASSKGWIEDVAEEAPREAKRVMVGNSGNEQLQRELNHMISTAQLCQTTRMMQAVAWWCVQCPATLLWPALQVVKAHAKQTKGQPNHKMGSPHIHLWRQFLRTFIDTLKEKNFPAEHLTHTHRKTSCRSQRRRSNSRTHVHSTSPNQATKGRDEDDVDVCTQLIHCPRSRSPTGVGDSSRPNTSWMRREKQEQPRPPLPRKISRRTSTK